MSEREKKKLQEKHEKILLDMMKSNEKNQFCADCRTKGPRWASTNLGVFLCMPCAGLHRKMGTHISKVKSITLDSWTEEQIEHFQKWGNEKANALYIPHPELHPVPTGDREMENYIRDKYERKVFMEGNKRNTPARDSSGRQDAGPERNYPNESSAALATLREMGWMDEQRNREVLARCRGDVNAAIEVLCSLPPSTAEQQRQQQQQQQQRRQQQQQQASGQQAFALAPPTRQQAADQPNPASPRPAQQQQQQQVPGQGQPDGSLDLLGDAFLGDQVPAQQQQRSVTKDTIMSLFTSQPAPAMGFGGPAFGGPSLGTNSQMQHPGFPGQQLGYLGQQQPGFPGQQQQGFPGQLKPGFPGQQQQGFLAQQQQVFPSQQQQGFQGHQQPGFPGPQQQGFPSQQQQSFPGPQQQGFLGPQAQGFLGQQQVLPVHQQGVLQQPGFPSFNQLGGPFGQAPQVLQPGYSQQANPFQQQTQGDRYSQQPPQQQQQQPSYQPVPGGRAVNPFISLSGGSQQPAQSPSQIPRQLGQQQFGLQSQQIQGQYQQPQQPAANNQAFMSLNPFGASGAVQDGGGKKAGGGNPFA